MKLAEIQRNLKAPKGQFNAFGKYKYRSAEDILEAVANMSVMDICDLVAMHHAIGRIARVLRRQCSTLH